MERRAYQQAYGWDTPIKTSICDWHPQASKFERPDRPEAKSLCREGDDLRRLISGRRILEVQPTKGI